MNLDIVSENEAYTALSLLSKDKSEWQKNLPHVAKLLNHPSLKVRAKSLWLLGEMGLLHPKDTQIFTGQIADMMFDAHEKIRERAVGALGRIGRGDYEVVKPYVGEMLKKATDEAPLVRMNFIWAAENIATNCPDALVNEMDIFAVLLDDDAERVRIEAPEIFRVMGKRRPEAVRPYLEKLQLMAENDENRVVRIHAEGAVKAANTL